MVTLISTYYEHRPLCIGPFMEMDETEGEMPAQQSWYCSSDCVLLDKRGTAGAALLSVAKSYASVQFRVASKEPCVR